MSGLTDLSPMPFGKFKGKPMQEVPVNYLHWLWCQKCSSPEVTQYIVDNLHALKLENKDFVWSL